MNYGITSKPEIYQSGDHWYVNCFEEEYRAYQAPFLSYDEAVSFVELITKYR